MRYVAALDDDIDRLWKGFTRERDVAAATAEQRDQERCEEIRRAKDVAARNCANRSGGRSSRPPASWWACGSYFGALN